MNDTFSPEVIQALAALRTYAARYPTMGLSGALNTLDNAGVFAALDEQTDYASAEEILAEAALRALEKKMGKPDPAEWGDTTIADMARHAGFEVSEVQDSVIKTPLVGQQADLYREGLRQRGYHAHVFPDGNPGTVCLGHPDCVLTYSEYREDCRVGTVCTCNATPVHPVASHAITCPVWPVWKAHHNL